MSFVIKRFDANLQLDVYAAAWNHDGTVIWTNRKEDAKKFPHEAEARDFIQKTNECMTSRPYPGTVEIVPEN